MKDRPENPFEPRLGRIRSGGNGRRGRTFMSKVARSVSRAGSTRRGPRTTRHKYRPGKFARRVVVKARIVRSSGSSPRALREHLRYISRDSAVTGEDKSRVFDATNEDVDRDRFAEAAKDDRHHFRLIVSPEDGAEVQEMKPFVRDLVSQMERDLETRLDWVAAVHDNTDHPHAHIVIRGKRDDGRDLVMPRAYISHTIRERAEELVTLELGPETKLKRDVKEAKQVRAERLTRIDRTLARFQDEYGVLDLAQTPIRYRSVNANRLRKLQSLGLAQERRPGRWTLANGFEQTLKELGERGDIIKQIHRALGARENRIVDPARPFAGAAGQVSMIGAVIRKGMGGDGHDIPYIILDGVDGRVVRSNLSNPEDIDGVLPGMIVKLQPPNVAPRSSDQTIAKIASSNGGIYSAALHHQTDPRSTPEFIRAHVRRLEALRRKGLVERMQSGEWRIPQNYLEKVRQFQERHAANMGAIADVESWADLTGQVEARGLTWLDGAPSIGDTAQGFADDVRRAVEERRAVLRNRGLLASTENELSETSIKTLKRAGLEQHGNDLANSLGQTYHPLPKTGRIEGVYTGSIKTAEGRFAIITRGKTLTLAPWRQVMERARGQAIAGVVRGDQISWQVGRNKGLGR